MRTKSKELLAVGIFGSRSRIGDRIEMLLRRGRTFSPQASASAVAASAVALGALIIPGLLAPRWIAFAQEPARLEFDVAFIKLSSSARGSVRQLKPGSLTYTNRVLAEYIQLAYGVQPYQVTHPPAVSLAERYDIIAKAAEPVAESQVKLMLRSLLEDRFKLTFHREIREFSAFILTVAKGGPHIKA